MLPYLNIGGFAIPVPAFVILGGVWIGLSVAEKYAKKHKTNPEVLYNLAFYSLIAGIVGARLSYVLRFPAAFIADPASLISINFGLFDPIGAAVVAVLFAIFYGQRNKMRLWNTLDALTPAFAVAGIALAAANLASGNAFGSETSLPWAIDLWGATRHPTQIYEAVAAGFIVWYLYPSRLPKKIIPGLIFLQFVGLSAISRILFEGFRGNSVVTILNLRVAQIAAWLVLGLVLWGITEIQKRQNQLQ